MADSKVETELKQARAMILTLEARANRAEGQVVGLERALAIAQTASELKALSAENVALHAQVKTLQDEMRECLFRAQTQTVNYTPQTGTYEHR